MWPTRSVATALLLQLPALWLAWSCTCHYWRMQWQQPACEMTYMYPSFVEINASSLGIPHHSQGYRLFEYVDQVNKPGPGDLVTPALFIPGNAGGYMQVRCMASETARLWAAQQSKHPGVPMKRVYIRWYAVDTREELGAFDGLALERQTQYTLQALRWLSLTYNLSAPQRNAQHRRYPHAGVVLVGHSMGGVVARAALLDAARDPALGPSRISALITLAAPLQCPPLAAHLSLQRFYAARRGSGPVPWVPMISLSGGFNDTQVAHPLTSPHGLHPAPIALHVSTSAVPGVWLAPAHNTIVWCNQLLKPLSLFTMDLAWQTHHGSHLAHTSKEGVTAATGAKESETAASAVNHFHHAGVVLASARRFLMPTEGTPSGLLAPLQQARSNVPEPQGAGQSQARASQPPLTPGQDAHLPAEGHQCTGPNLMWYRQYGKEKQVKKRACMASCGGGTYLAKGDAAEGVNGTGNATERCSCAVVLRLQGVKDAQQLQRLRGGGRLYRWQLKAARPATFHLRVSSAPPCQAFRIWLIAETINPASGSPEQEDPDNPLPQGRTREAMVEITRLAAWLPMARPEARRNVRQWSLSDEVMSGVDYNDTASWALVLPTTLLAQYNTITLWAGSPSNATAYHLTAQLFTQPPQPTSSSPDSPAEPHNPAHTPIRLSWHSFLAPVHVPANSPAILPVHLALGATFLQYDQLVAYITRLLPVRTPHAPAWVQPVVEVLLDCINAVLQACVHTSGLHEHIALQVLPRPREPQAQCMHTTVFMPCAPSSKGLHQASGGRVKRDGLGRTGEHECGDAAHMSVANRTVYGLQSCWDTERSCSLAVLVDPACGGYTVRLVLDVSHQLPGLMLENLNVVVQLAQAMVMAVVAWQLCHIAACEAGSTGNNLGTANPQNLGHMASSEPTTGSPPIGVATGFTLAFIQACASASQLAVNLSFWAASGLLAVACHWLSGQLLLPAQQYHEPEEAPGDLTGQPMFSHVMPYYQSRAQLTATLFVTLIPGLAVLVSHFSYRHSLLSGRPWLLAASAWLGAVLPWVATSPRVSHSYSSHASKLGLWICSASDCSTAHGPSISNLIILLVCTCLAVFTLTGVVGLLQAIVHWITRGIARILKGRSKSVSKVVVHSASEQQQQPATSPKGRMGQPRGGDSAVTDGFIAVDGTGAGAVEGGGAVGNERRATGTPPRVKVRVLLGCGVLIGAGGIHVALALLLALVWLCVPHGVRPGPGSPRQQVHRVLQDGWRMVLAIDCLVLGASGVAAIVNRIFAWQITDTWQMSDACDVLLVVLPTVLVLTKLDGSVAKEDARLRNTDGIVGSDGTQGTGVHMQDVTEAPKQAGVWNTQDGKQETTPHDTRADRCAAPALVMTGCACAAFACAALGIDFALFHVQAIAAGLLFVL